MQQAYATSGQIAKSGATRNGYDLSETDTGPSIHQQITAFFKSLQPLKTWGLIADALGLREHAAKHRAANHRDYSIEELQVLLHSDSGAEILEMLMADAEPEWWRALKINLNLSKALAAQAQWQQTVMSLDATPIDRPTRRKLKKVINADRAFNAARAQKEVAAGLLHQNVNRPVDRVMAATAGKAKIPAAGMRARV
ncbi:hypothetical protein [Tardiphaga sp. 803_E3_N1_3]|uniref:hypothetical protein n=1 Tax=Tardiphaga sp. 803_E3_N1_3 TaxID=3240785 RepID=UPI003F2300D5